MFTESDFNRMAWSYAAGSFRETAVKLIKKTNSEASVNSFRISPSFLADADL